MDREPRFLAMDNILMGSGEPLQKGQSVGLSELAGCDVNHLLKIKAIRPFEGEGMGSALLLRKDNPSPAEFIVEIARLQSALEKAEDDNDDLRRNRPTPSPSTLPPDVHLMAERIAELDQENRGLRHSLKNTAEARDAAQGRADKYAASLGADPLATAGKGEGFGLAPTAPDLLDSYVDSVANPVPAISARYKADQAASEAVDVLVSAGAGAAPEGVKAGTPAGIKATTKVHKGSR